MRAVDTNVLVRLLEQDDPGQAAVAEAFRLRGGPLWVSHIVLVETVWVLESVFHHTKREVLGVLDALVNNQELHLQESAVVSQALGHFRNSKADFSACLALEVARSQGHLPLATSDKHLVTLPDAIPPKSPPS